MTISENCIAEIFSIYGFFNSLFWQPQHNDEFNAFSSNKNSYDLWIQAVVSLKYIEYYSYREIYRLEHPPTYRALLKHKIK